MTQSLTERLQERLATQSAEIERLTASELAQLGERLRRESEAALASMRSAIHESIETTRRPLLRDLERLRGIGRWWWGTLLLSWATIAMLLAFSLWLWTRPETGGIATYETFTTQGRTFLLLPEGTEALTCTQGERRRACVVLPSLETMLERERGAAADGTNGRTPTGETGGTPTEPPAARPPPRPGGS